MEVILSGLVTVARGDINFLLGICVGKLEYEQICFLLKDSNEGNPGQRHSGNFKGLAMNSFGNWLITRVCNLQVLWIYFHWSFDNEIYLTAATLIRASSETGSLSYKTSHPINHKTRDKDWISWSRATPIEKDRGGFNCMLMSPLLPIFALVWQNSRLGLLFIDSRPRYENDCTIHIHTEHWGTYSSQRRERIWTSEPSKGVLRMITEN